MIIPHQANQRILDAAAERLERPRMSGLPRCWNGTATPRRLRCLSRLMQARPGAGSSEVIWWNSLAVGAGFTVGATLVRWS